MSMTMGQVVTQLQQEVFALRAQVAAESGLVANHRASRRLVLCGDRVPTQEPVVEVETAQDSVETTQRWRVRFEGGSSTTHRWRMCGHWRIPFQMTLPKKTTTSHCGALTVIPRVPTMRRRRSLSVTQEFELASWGSGRWMSFRCVMHLSSEVDAECPSESCVGRQFEKSQNQ